MTLSLLRRSRTITPKKDFKIRNGASRVAWHAREEIPEVGWVVTGEGGNADLVRVEDTIDSERSGWG